MVKHWCYHFLIAYLFVLVNTKCPKDWAEFKNECLLFSYDRQSWSSSQSHCRLKQAYLATDDSQEKHNFIRQIISVLDVARIKDFFIGGNDRVFEGQWRWLETGSPISKFTAWAPDTPSTNMTLAAQQNCMMLTWVDDDIYWSDHDCSDRKGHYICEKQASSFTNPPVIG